MLLRQTTACESGGRLHSAPAVLACDSSALVSSVYHRPPARLPACLPGVSDSRQPTMQPVCEDHPCVHVSDVSYSVTHTMQLDCQPFVHKHNGFSQALSGSSFSQALLLISTSTYMERLGSSWVDSALCYGFETKSLDALQIP